MNQLSGTADALRGLLVQAGRGGTAGSSKRQRRAAASRHWRRVAAGGVGLIFWHVGASHALCDVSSRRPNCGHEQSKKGPAPAIPALITQPQSGKSRQPTGPGRLAGAAGVSDDAFHCLVLDDARNTHCILYDRWGPRDARSCACSCSLGTASHLFVHLHGQGLPAVVPRHSPLTVPAFAAQISRATPQAVRHDGRCEWLDDGQCKWMWTNMIRTLRATPILHRRTRRGRDETAVHGISLQRVPPAAQPSDDTWALVSD